MQPTKMTLRTEMLQRRLTLPATEVQAMGRAAQERLMGLDAWRDAGEVLLYMDFRNEVPTDMLLRDAWTRGLRVALPRCRPKGEEAGMELAYATCVEELTPGRYGIQEPDPALCVAEEQCAPDLAVLPGVVFDRYGYRLGYGAGYYDRLLSDQRFQHTLVVGLSFEFQVVDELPRDEWDRPVAAVCTERELLWR